MIILNRDIFLGWRDLFDLGRRIAHRANLLQQEFLKFVLVLSVLVEIDKFAVRLHKWLKNYNFQINYWSNNSKCSYICDFYFLG